MKAWLLQIANRDNNAICWLQLASELNRRRRKEEDVCQTRDQHKNKWNDRGTGREKRRKAEVLDPV